MLKSLNAKVSIVPYLKDGKYMAVGNYKKEPTGIFGFSYGGGAFIGTSRLDALNKFLESACPK